jgi:hypothetical protein
MSSGFYLSLYLRAPGDGARRAVGAQCPYPPFLRLDPQLVLWEYYTNNTKQGGSVDTVQKALELFKQRFN